MKKLIYFLAMIALFVASTAQAGNGEINNINLDRGLRHKRICIPQFLVAPSGIEAGTSYVINSMTVNGASAPTSTTTAIFSMPYQARLEVIMVDSGTNDPRCASAIVTGYNEWNEWQTETVTSVDEDPQYTSKVFSRVLTVTGVTCTAGAAAGDHLRVGVSEHVGLGVNITSYYDIESVCLIDNSDSSTTKCMAHNDGTTADIESLVSVANDTIDVDATAYGGTKVAPQTNVDTICIRVRGEGKR